MHKHTAIRLISLVLLALTITSCTSCATQAQPVNELPQGTDGSAWWNDTVFYEIFVRSFYDSDGDGIGDFNGIIEKLDYLNGGDAKKKDDLGVTGIWLMPINPAASYHGYDVTNYYDVNPDYGSMEDFKRLIEECHKHGIRVIIDLVINHTSNQNPWFIEARDNPDSARHDWYIWSQTDPGYLGPWNEKVWYPSIAGWYYAIFWSGMPDLNYRDQDVTNEMHKVARFWLQEVGVDGFRLDAARYLVEEGKNQADTGSTHTWWENFRTLYKEINPEALTVGEVWTTNYAVASYLEGDELDMAFNFDQATQTMRNVGNRNATNLGTAIQRNATLFDKGTYASFLTNHDQERVMSAFSGDQDKAKLAATVLFTAPGTPFIYYGEEIGMTGDKPDEYIRTPMLWSAEKYAGFSTILPWQNINNNYKDFNVATEISDPGSLLSHYRNLINLRNEHAALRAGDYYLLRSDNPAILAFLRVSESETLMVLINMSNDAASGYTISLNKGPLSGSYRLMLVNGQDDSLELNANTNGGFDPYQLKLEIPANGYVILQMPGG